MTDKTSLTPRDWVIAAFAALAEGGLDAVRVERLAKRLGTTKGSFYWHFADRPALLEAMLTLWEREGTTDLIEHLAGIVDPAARLRQLATEALILVTGGIDVARSETAMRVWAAQDPAVGLRFARVEGERLRALTAELARLGYGPAEATSLAKVLYLALIGLYSVRPYAPELADDQALLDLVERVIAAAPGLQDRGAPVAG